MRSTWSPHALHGIHMDHIPPLFVCPLFVLLSSSSSLRSSSLRSSSSIRHPHGWTDRSPVARLLRILKRGLFQVRPLRGCASLCSAWRGSIRYMISPAAHVTSVLRIVSMLWPRQYARVGRSHVARPRHVMSDPSRVCSSPVRRVSVY